MSLTAIGNGNTVGVIPYLIGGGLSSYTPLIGYGCENIVSARVVTAAGNIVVASSTENPELLWGIRGAGQLLGLVVEVDVRVYPFSHISEDGSRQLGTYIFPAEKAEAVFEAVGRIIEDERHAHVGHLMIAMNPQEPTQQIIMVAPQLFGTDADMVEVMKPLVDLAPLMQMQMKSTFETHSDHLGFLCDKGEFKRFSQTGLAGYAPKNFQHLVKMHKELVETNPGSHRSQFAVEWHTPTKSPATGNMETAFGMKDVENWLYVLLSSDPLFPLRSASALG